MLLFPSTDWLQSELEGRGGVLLPDGTWRFESVSALDLLGLAFDGHSEESELFSRYNCWRQHDGRGAGVLRVTRLRKDAVVPSKSRVSDSGYDVTLVHLAKQVGKVSLYGTGLIIAPPDGWYFDVVARSSIIKTGHMLANNVGVIDRGYRGEVLVPVIRVDSEAPPLSLPIRLVQLVPRPVVHFPVVEFTESEATARAEGGFGSTGS